MKGIDVCLWVQDGNYWMKGIDVCLWATTG